MFLLPTSFKVVRQPGRSARHSDLPTHREAHLTVERWTKLLMWPCELPASPAASRSLLPASLLVLTGSDGVLANKWLCQALCWSLKGEPFPAAGDQGRCVCSSQVKPRSSRRTSLLKLCLQQVCLGYPICRRATGPPRRCVSSCGEDEAEPHMHKDAT